MHVFVWPANALYSETDVSNCNRAEQNTNSVQPQLKILGKEVNVYCNTKITILLHLSSSARTIIGTPAKFGTPSTRNYFRVQKIKQLFMRTRTFNRFHPKRTTEQRERQSEAGTTNSIAIHARMENASGSRSRSRTSEILTRR